MRPGPCDSSRLLQGGVAAGIAALMPSIARAAAIAPDARTRSLQDLQHIVVLMQENRSFDHYFGTLPGVRGFGDRFVAPASPLPGGDRPRSLWLQPDASGQRAIAPFPLDTAAHFGYMRVEGTPHTDEFVMEARSGGANPLALGQKARAGEHGSEKGCGLRAVGEDWVILLQVRDDGEGFDPDGPRGLGLIVMRERAQWLLSNVDDIF